ncbi:MAG: sugar ABC transporter substrate-binding protein [Tissierellaceae bacterium]|nr:sugar ABC transporter substrate-binding protein [Tissierellaceae bacterium]
MRKIKKVLSLILALVIILSVTACNTSGNDKKASGEEKYTIAVLAWSLAEEFGVDIVTGAEKKAQELGVRVVAPDPAGDMQKEISIIEDLIQQKVDAIAIAPVDADAIVPYIDKIREAGIVVVDYDIETEAEVDAKVLSDNYDGGRMAAEYLVQEMGNMGKVLILEDAPGVTTAEERIAGFAEEMKKYPNIEIVRQLSSGTRDTHRSTTENMLTAHPDITGIFCFMGDNTLGAYAAVKAMGRTDVKIAGYDASPEQVEIMKNDGPDCQIISSVALYPKAIGRVALETAYKILEGEVIDEVVWTELGMLTAKEADSFVDKD